MDENDDRRPPQPPLNDATPPNPHDPIAGLLQEMKKREADRGDGAVQAEGQAEPCPVCSQPFVRPPGEACLVITTLGTQLNVQGPLHDLIWCYGVLERAKDVIRAMAARRPGPERTPSGLVVPRGGFKPPR